jgi:hypothetical protein
MIIRALKEDRPRREQMGRNARNLLESSFRKRYALRRWEGLLRGIGPS